MFWVGVHAIAVSIWAWTFYGAIAVFDRGNPKNTLALAVLVAIVTDVAATSLPDLYFLIAWLVFMVRLTSWHYHLSLLGSLLVAATTVFAPYFLIDRIVSFFVVSEFRAEILLYGLPLLTFGGAIVGYVRRTRSAGEQPLAPDDKLPAARVTRWRKSPAPPIPVVTAPIAPPVAPAPAAPPPETPRLLV